MEKKSLENYQTAVMESLENYLLNVKDFFDIQSRIWSHKITEGKVEL